MIAEDRALLDQVQRTVRAIEPAARILLYGSRARGEAGPDSDWDLLILLEGSVDDRRADAIRDVLFDLGLETNSALTAIVRSRAEWESPRYRRMPFRVNVTQDAIEL